MPGEVIHLLSERNRYLSQFCVLNRVQIERLKKNNFEQLSEFYLMREQILAIVEKIEHLIHQKAESYNGPIDAQNREKIQSLLTEKDKIIKDIVDQDLAILSSIEKEKTNIITELKVLQKGRKVISSYKSGNRNSKIDEEA